MRQPRSQNEIIWALNEWSKCTTLDPFERGLVQNLHRAASQSEDAFDQLATALLATVRGGLISAMNKANAQGLCLKWPPAEQ